MTQPVTLKDIAREANLSVAAVSKALSGHVDASPVTRERVQAISDKMNYQPRRRGGRKSTGGKVGRVAFVLSGMHEQREGPLRNTRIDYMTRLATSHRVSLQLTGIDDLAGAADKRFLREFDAIAICGDQIGYPLLEKADALGLPWLAIGSPIGEGGDGFDRGHIVIEPSADMGLVATAALIKHGHSRIGFVAGGRVKGGWNIGWLRGYQAALLEKDLPIEPALMPRFDRGSLHEARTSAADWFASLDPMPTAWVVPSASGAERFVSGMAGHGVSIHKNQLVTCRHLGDLQPRDSESVRDFPAIEVNLEDECRLAVETLQVLTDGGFKEPARHYVPYKCTGFEPLCPLSSQTEQSPPP